MLVVTVRVRPGAARTVVGGRYPAATGAALVVRVSEPAVDGRATLAVVKAVAAAFGVRRSAVEVLSGAKSRTKVLRLSGADKELSERLAVLLGD